MKNWRCPKCGTTYDSPVKVKEVVCPPCTSKNKNKVVLMKPVGGET